MYGYVLQDPVNFYDPNGLRPLPGFSSTVQGVLAGAITGGATGSAFVGIGAIPGAIGGAILGGILGYSGQKAGGSYQTVVDMTSGGVVGGAAGLLSGSAGVAVFTGGAAVTYCSGVGHNVTNQLQNSLNSNQ